jgi:hypothetical protein
MDNPYASPNPTNAFGGKNPTGLPAGGRERGLVGHVRVLGILMLVHGVLALLCGLLFIAMAIFFPMIFAAMEPPPNARAGEPSPEFIAGIAGGVYGAIGLITLIAGGLQIYAGYQTLSVSQTAIGNHRADCRRRCVTLLLLQHYRDRSVDLWPVCVPQCFRKGSV